MGRGQLAVGSGQLAGKKDRALTGVRGDREESWQLAVKKDRHLTGIWGERKNGVTCSIRLIILVFLAQSDKKKIGK